MTDFQDIIKLRNRGCSQKQIANKLFVSLRTVQRYLKTGTLPIYKRSKATKEDPFLPYKKIVSQIFNDSSISLKPRAIDIYIYLSKLGYKGSLRTVSRKTKELRKSLANKELYFEQNVLPGVMLEGDFTIIDIPFIFGTLRKHLWVSTLKNSGASFAKSFDNQTFESFAQGSVDSFEYFGGVPEYYRLDNLSPVVKKILKNHRVTTSRYNELVNHYKFKSSFCNAGKGNEKGSVESINKHFKNYLLHDISLNKKVFNDNIEWEVYVSKKLEEFNFSKREKLEVEKKELKALPQSCFPCFSFEVQNVNKYGFIRIGSIRYSVPSEYKYKTLEIRSYYNRIELFCGGVKIKEHPKHLYKRNNTATVIDYRDHIDDLLRKPAAFTYYKHKESFFPCDIFKDFYDKYPDNRNYLECLKLSKTNSIKEIEASINLLLNEYIMPTATRINEILYPEIKQEKYDINYLMPLEPKLDCYDAILF